MGIATGGVVPEGADAVVPIELVSEQGDRLTVPDAVAPGANVRPRGGDVRPATRSSPPARSSTRTSSRRCWPPASGSVRVGARPRVGVLATGSELRPAGTPLEPGQVYDANGPMLAAQAARAGAEPARLVAVEDDEAAHREALERGLGHDVLVTSGGVSVGPHDLVRSVGAELGVEEVFWGIAMRPGKPLWFGTRGGDARLRPARQPRVLVRLLRALRPPGAARAAGRTRHPRRRSSPATLAGAVRRNGRATTSCGRGAAPRASCRSRARSRT